MASNPIQTQNLPRPVFISGCERSGTTVLGSLLGSHPNAIAVPESQFKFDLIELSESGAWSDASVESVFAKNWRFSLLWGEIAIGQQAGATVESTVHSCLTQYGGDGLASAKVWIDNTGHNSRYATRLLRHFPNARFIHIVRDGRAVAASVMPLQWGPNSITGAAHWWMGRLGVGLAMESHLSDRVARVSYESLVEEPERVLRGLCDFIGLQFDPVMLTGAGYSPSAYAESQHALVGGPAQVARAGAFRQSLSEGQIELFEAITGDMLTYLDYDLMTSGRRATRRSRLAVRDVATEVGRRAGNVIRQRRRVTRARRASGTPQ